MIFLLLNIFLLVVTRVINSCNVNLSSFFFIRITAILFIYAGILYLNILYIQSIESGIELYSGLFQVTSIPQYFEIFFNYFINYNFILFCIISLLIFYLYLIT